MFKNVSPKAIALGGITFAGLGIIGTGVEVTKGFLFEIQNARAATSAAMAELEKAKAEGQKAIAAQQAADASKLDAQNKLLAAVEARNAAILASQYMAQGVRDSAVTAGNAQLGSVQIDKLVDNETYTNLTKPLFIDPARKIAKMNGDIVRLKQRIKQVLNESEKAESIAEVERLEDEKAIVEETSAKNMGDLVSMVMKGLGGGFGRLNPSAERSGSALE